MRLVLVARLFARQSLRQFNRDFDPHRLAVLVDDPFLDRDERSELRHQPELEPEVCDLFIDRVGFWRIERVARKLVDGFRLG